MNALPAGREPWSHDPAYRLSRHSRWASIGLILILAAISVFALWSSHASATAGHSAAETSKLSDDYAAAAAAVALEASLQLKYRLEPGAAAWADFNDASAQLLSAMALVKEDGDPADRALAADVLTTHREYLIAVVRLFSASDRGDQKAVERIAHDQARPPYEAVEAAVNDAAADHHQESLAELAHLQRLEVVTGRLTPLVFLVGLLLAAALASVTRGLHRLRNSERAQAIHDSLHDALTGLPNRKLLDDRLAQALRAARRDGTTVGLLLIDLDRFKEINDTFGHRYGDLLLAQIGPRLATALREVDTVARLGGDEFAIVLPSVADRTAANQVAEKLRVALGSPFHVENVDFDVEASIGIVLSGDHGQDATILLQRADIAMYVAKTQSLGVFTYNPSVDGHSPAKLALLGDLRRAMERDELVLHYQPKVSISSGDVIGAEALVRWQHPSRGLIQPDDFIPLAEHTGLIGPLTRYVLTKALRQARVWADAGRPLQVAVNLSARNLLDDHLPAMVRGLLAEYRVPAHMLELEVTESALMTEPGRARRLLEELTEVGVRISIDDFGAGYTSLGQLKDLPVSELKIDRSFVTTMTRDHGGALIVQSVIELGHNLGLTIVAEGVETIEALEALASFGCDVAQGYFLSSALPLDSFDPWLRDWPAAGLLPDSHGGTPHLTP